MKKKKVKPVVKVKDLKAEDRNSLMLKLAEAVTLAFLRVGVAEFTCETDKSILTFKKKIIKKGKK